ncbi:hypothetical protein ACNKHT_06860 [Shigella flexneri]
MLGEAALIAAVHKRIWFPISRRFAIGKASNGRGISEGPGISIELSALRPRTAAPVLTRVMEGFTHV